MANPPIFQSGFSYSNWQATNPEKPLPAQQVDNDFANVARSVNQAISAIGDVRRSDGKLKNGIVGPEALAAQLSLGFSFEGTWAVDYEYQAGDGVVFSQTFYAARVSHTSTVLNQPGDEDTWTLLFSLDDIVVAGALSMPVATFLSNGTTDEFDLGFFPVSSRNLFVTIGGQIQEPTDYTINGSLMRFINGAPPTGPTGEAYTIVARGFATTATLVTPEDGSVTTVKLATGAVTTPKLADASVTEPKLGSALSAALARTTLFSPGVLTGELGAAKPHVEDYSTGVSITGDSAVLKIQAAIDANQSNVLIMPDALIKLADTLYFWRSMDFEGARDENFWQEFGDSTGGTAHPRTGTILCPVGAGVPRQWSDIGNSEDDTANTPMIAVLANDIKITGLSMRMGLNGVARWAEYIHVCGARGLKLHKFGAQGLGLVGAKRAFVVDGTWSKFNTNILGTLAGGWNDGAAAFQHVRDYIKAGKLDPNLMAAGPTDIKISEQCILAGVKTVIIQGRKGSFPGGQNPYGPNGISDFDCKANLYNDGPLLERMTDGGTVFIDYKLPGGNPVVNSVSGDNGQNIRFKGRLDPNAKYAVKISHGHKVLIDTPYLETGSSYQDAVAAYNLANSTTFDTRAIIETDETCTGEVAIVTPGAFASIRTNGIDTPVLLRDFNVAPAFGKMIDYDGRQNGERNGPLGRVKGWLVDSVREIFSFEALGQINFVRVLRTSRDSFFRARWKSAGKGEISTNGTDWVDFETGTWTPDLVGATTAGTYAFASRSGTWTKTARSITYRGTMTLSAITVAGTGQMRIPLPLASGNRPGNVATMHSGDYNALALTAGTVLSGFVATNTAYIGLVMAGAASTANMASANLTATSRIGFEVTIEI